MKKLLIFDLDGTLLDTVDDLANAANAALDELGFPPHTPEEYKHFVGGGIAKLCERALPEGEKDKVSAMLVPFGEYYDAHCTDCTRPYAGIVPLLTACQAAGYTLAVASNKAQAFTQKLIDCFFDSSVFALVLGSDDKRPRKPDPTILTEICATLQIAPAESVLIGDSETDLKTAENAAMDCIACTWGFRMRTSLEEAGASVCVDTPQQLENLLLSPEFREKL